MTWIARLLCLALTGVASTAAGCGGKVVLDAGHGGSTTGAGGNATTGGGGGTTTGTVGSVTTGTTTSSGGVECSGTYAQLGAAVEGAQQCDPTLQIVQCSGKVTVHDVCGCEVVANETNPDAVGAANTAWNGCEAIGCCGPGAHPITPPSCMPCPTPPIAGACDPQTGLCVSVVPD